MKHPWLLLAVGLLAVQASYAQNAVNQTRTPPAEAVATPVLNRLDAAWNAADGAAFVREFAADADVINIFGGYFHGSAAIAERMQAIFNTIFKGSVHRSRTLEVVRYLDAA